MAMLSTSLQNLPLDVFQDNFLSYLTYNDVLALSATSKSLHSSLSTTSLWHAFLRHQSWHDIVQTKYLLSLPVRLRAAVGDRAERGWANHTFKADSMFAQRWQRKCLPRLEISMDYVAVGVGADMQIHWVQNMRFFDTAQEKKWMVYNLGKHGSDDITEIIPVKDVPTEFIISQANGLIRHLAFDTQDTVFTVKKVYSHHRAIVRSLSMTKDYLVAVSSTSSDSHAITFFSTQNNTQNDQEQPESSDDEDVSPEVNCNLSVSHPTRPWQALFLSPTEFALGSTSPEALSIFSFSPESSNPLQKSRQLFSYPSKLGGLPESAPHKTSIYAMMKYAPSLLLSGWYHGPANIHDLRIPSSYPVLDLNDPMDEGAAYSVSTDGSHRILVGSANHGLVKVFDIRMPDRGWSIYLGRERSPVYAIRAEHSRIYAATEGTVWECDPSYIHKPRKYDEGSWRTGRLAATFGRGGRAWNRRRGVEESHVGGQVRLHYGSEKLYREDGSEIGKTS